MEELLEIADATVKHRGEVLFENLNFGIRKGEHWAVVGESGSGKSALLHTLAGKHILSQGSIHHHFYGEFISKNPVTDPYFTYHDLIAFVDIKHDFRNLSNTSDFYYQQRYNAWDSDDAPTVADFLEEKAGKATHKHDWTPDKIYEKFDLEPLRHKQLIKLSNGESKRMRIAAALLKGPALLLLDNPLAGLDVETRRKFGTLLSEIGQSGIAIVMTTSPLEIPDIITHVATLDAARKLKARKKADFSPGSLNPQAQNLPEPARIKKLLGQKEKIDFDVVVKMENVSVRYGENLILKNIEWEIKQGERWVLSGPNGSGKSTLLSLINGDNPQAYANEITLFDRKRGTGESIWDIKKKTGFMSPELYQYFPQNYSCLHVVESGFRDTLGLFTESDAAQRALASEWLEIMELAHLKEVKLCDISASRQRLCLLARALVKDPYLLILDEPCQGLDLHQQNYFRSIIDMVCELSKLSLIYVTHYREELPSCITNELKLR